MELKILPEGRLLQIPEGQNLMEVLRREGIHLDAPCGGMGKCGKCRVFANGTQVLACQTPVDRDMEVFLPESPEMNISQTGIGFNQAIEAAQDGYLLTIDIGTTSVVCALLEGNTGTELASAGMRNPQTAFGADVISRIRAALRGEPLTRCVREGMTTLIQSVCEKAGISPDEIRLVCPVGNPAMQQLFLGISPENLAEIPFAPVLTAANILPCGEILPICSNARLLIVPDISGYIGADTMGCILATELYGKEEITLLVDIGTNGEMVLGNKDRMVACSTAAGPALEGANIQFGMRGTEGVIDHVWLENGEVKYSVIGGGAARGICGSGLIDAVAVGLDTGLLNQRGRIQNEAHRFPLTDKIYLTQEDIRQVQLAKGAICAGILLMTRHLGLEIRDIGKVLLAGAFGSHIHPRSACRIGLLPEELSDRIEAVGNAALAGAKILAFDERMLDFSQELREKVEFLELASLPGFSKTFAKAMRFREEPL